MNNKIITVGHIALDYIFNVAELPKPNTSVQIPTAKKYYGGAACNVAVGAVKLGISSGIISCVGQDIVSSGYSNYLKNLGVDISGVYHSENEETPKAWIFTDPQNNQITFFLWGAAKHYPELSVPSFDCDIVHLATGDAKFNVRCAKSAKSNGTMVSFDPGQDLPQYNKEDMEDMVNNVDFMFMNNHEYERVLDLLNVDLDYLTNKINILVITYGKDGSIIYHGGKKIEIPVIPANSIDPTGAGDSYRAGFLTAYLKGMDLYDCGKIASCMASFVVEKKGCQTNFPTWDEIMHRLEKTE
ncbi:carbohydrate kinase family protein [Methanococcus aeolicus]|uniref:PfkB domain protein n=1 Tax=Methanococcus aeolicus (strain ATCC BAA-1280 / DSM 17508 / OCM 812 / Nankai-3) TaxID=419665 RepID=A6UWA6_META3|nr:carbohydrate kinase family protein [Methanococcus aeolicus]ABR56778.1 PfkB domain protein [Methanococcus aeolicus Nankai-3]UXM84791.1 carbohydrate kinase family protein [Methanococcus aeolicus]